MNLINDKINHIAQRFFDGNNSKFAGIMETSEANIRNYRKNTLPKIEFIINLHKKLNISYDWLLSNSYEQNEQSFIINTENENYSRARRIPLYDPLYNKKEEILESFEENITNPVAHIDPGSWFPEATAAVRYYGNHMKEYPNGCILVTRRISVDEIVFGMNYVILTKKGFITSSIQEQLSSKQIVAAPTENSNKTDKTKISNNTFIIALTDILDLYSVLGCVIK